MGALNFAKWIILIFVGLWVVWFLTGGPERATSRGGIYIKPKPSTENSWKTYGGKFSLFGSDGSKDSGSSSGDNTSQPDETDKDLEEIRDELEKAQEIAGTSYYKDKIILRQGKAKDDDIDEEYLIIESSRSNKDRICITGWRLESVMTGKKVTIEKTSHLPYTSKVNPQETICIYPGDKAYINTGRSPIGTSFRTNICTGYFEQFQDFEPSLRKNCPLPEDEGDFAITGPNAFNDQCIDYIEDLSRCEINTDPLPLNMQSECVTYINEEINYNSCVDKHKNDPDFYSSEWRIFLSRSVELWKSKREIVKLLDNNDKLVDTVSY